MAANHMLSIGEVAERTGLRASALRYYEEAGLIEPAGRVSGRRHYDPAVLDRLQVIACAQDAGFTIAEVRELLGGTDEPPARWRALAERKLVEVDAVIQKAEATRRLLEESLRCNCVALEDCATVLGATPAERPSSARRRRS
ncbi:MAG: MerR family transcriptional regulator [Actinomycetota bacterium]|nr:MerR family transcriptional regulator [Actinomycetota bacterium]